VPGIVIGVTDGGTSDDLIITGDETDFNTEGGGNETVYATFVGTATIGVATPVAVGGTDDLAMTTTDGWFGIVTTGTEGGTEDLAITTGDFGNDDAGGRATVLVTPLTVITCGGLGGGVGTFTGDGAGAGDGDLTPEASEAEVATPLLFDDDTVTPEMLWATVTDDELV
jgi:hypothetical protein